MPFPQPVKERALISCGRFCCLCHKFCGSKMECNHIVPEAEGGEDSLENCIPLCFDCHAEVGAYNLKHPKGNKFTSNELRAHRDNWFKKVQNPTPAYLDVQVLEVDRVLFRKIRDNLSYNLMSFFKEHDYGANFPAENHEIVWRFHSESEDPAFRFLDERMQGCLDAFLVAIHDFRRSWSNRIFIDNDQLRQTGQRVLGVPREWIYGRPEELQLARYQESVSVLNKAAEEFYAAYSEFIINGRRILGVA